MTKDIFMGGAGWTAGIAGSGSNFGIPGNAGMATGSKTGTGMSGEGAGAE